MTLVDIRTNIRLSHLFRRIIQEAEKEKVISLRVESLEKMEINQAFRTKKPQADGDSARSLPREIFNVILSQVKSKKSVDGISSHIPNLNNNLNE